MMSSIVILLIPGKTSDVAATQPTTNSALTANTGSSNQ